MRRVVGKAGHFEGLLNDAAGFRLATDTIGVELESGSVVEKFIFIVTKGIEGCPLSIDLILNDYVVDD